jgi:hypothetical protein
MIWCTLVEAYDDDTRAHATGALQAVLKSTRAVDASLATLSEMTGSFKPPEKDGDTMGPFQQELDVGRPFRNYYCRLILQW